MIDERDFERLARCICRPHDSNRLVRGAHADDDFAALLGAGPGASEIREMPLRLVMPGMTIMQDLHTHMGTLLVPRGFEVSETFIERLRNFGDGILAEKVKVLVPAAKGITQ